MVRLNVPGLAPRSRGRVASGDRSRARRAPGRALASHLASRAPVGEDRLASSAGFARRHQPSPRAFIRPRPAPLGVAFLLTAVWFVLNVQHPSPLDVLPFVWTWVTLWLALSICWELWRRYAADAIPTGRRRRS